MFGKRKWFEDWKKIVNLVLVATLSLGTPAYVYGEGKSPGTPTSLSDTAGDTDTGQDSSGLADIPSRRILFATDDPSIIRDTDTITSSYGDVYLVQYGSTKEAGEAYQYYSEKADFVDYDTAIAAAEGTGETPAPTGTVMTAKENPLAELSAQVKDDKKQGDTVGTEKDGHPLVALVDSGAPKNDSHIVDAVSMIGDDPYDDNGHGTQMAGGIEDIDQNARILSIKVLDANGTGSISAVYAGIQYAIQQKVSIINLSISASATNGNAILSNAIQQASDAGIVVVGAAGNNGRDVKNYTPGNIAQAYIIGSCQYDGKRTYGTNYGDTIDYMVSSNTTSEAASHFSGILSAMKLKDGWQDSLLEEYKGVVFPNDTASVYDNEGKDAEDDGMFSGQDLMSGGINDLIMEGTNDNLNKVKLHISLSNYSDKVQSIQFYNDGDQSKYVSFEVSHTHWTIGNRSGDLIAELDGRSSSGLRWYNFNNVSFEGGRGVGAITRTSFPSVLDDKTLTLHLQGGVANGDNGDFHPRNSGADIVLGSGGYKMRTGAGIYNSIKGLTFSKTGYTFGGFELNNQLVYNADGTGSEGRGIWKRNIYNGSGGLTYASFWSANAYAIWHVNQYQFDLNGVENHATADVYVNGRQVAKDVHDWYKKYDYGSVIEVKDIKPDPGYHVVGATYYKQTMGTNGWACNITIKPNTYTVHYDGNDNSNTTITVPDQTVTHDTDFTTRTNAYEAPDNKDAYVFDGWRSSQKCGGTDIWALTSYGVAESGKGPWKWTEPFADGTTITLTARWKYNVIFDPNISTVSTVVDINQTGMPTADSPLVCHYKEDQALPANTYTVYGYSFVGWNTDSSATTALYKDGDTISTNPTPNNGSTVTLYAIWKADAYPITYRLQKDSDAEIDMPATVSLANKKTVVYPAHGGLYFENPRMTNARFTGWTCAELGVTDKTKDLTVSSDQVKAWYGAKTDKADNVGLTMVAHFETVPPFEFVDEKTGETPILNETEKNQGKFRIEEIESSPGYIYEDQYHDIDIRDKDDTHEYQDNDYRNLTFPEKNGK